jgi:phage shock protein PspC (stress-responsive transcriptional regulator)
MTENPTIAEPLGPSTTPPPDPAAATPPPTYTPPRRLVRSRSDRVFGGVCGGIGRHYDIDPVLIRILVVVATVFTGGVFALAYVLAWLFVPDEPGYPVALASQPTPASFAAGGTGSYVDPATGQVYGGTAYASTPPRRTEPRSYLGLFTVSAALVVGALLGLANALGASISGLTIFAAVLLVLGAGLLLGAWRGRARWLIAPALVVLLLVQGTAAVHHLVGTTSGVGDRRWTPVVSQQAFQLGAGSATLDLRKVPTGDATYTANLGIGELTVVVPADTELVLVSSIGLGEIDLPSSRPQQGSDLRTSTTVAALTTGPSTRTVDLTAEIGLGQLVVRRATS